MDHPKHRESVFNIVSLFLFVCLFVCLFSFPSSLKYCFCYSERSSSLCILFPCACVSYSIMKQLPFWQDTLRQDGLTMSLRYQRKLHFSVIFSFPFNFSFYLFLKLFLNKSLSSSFLPFFCTLSINVFAFLSSFCSSFLYFSHTPSMFSFCSSSLSLFVCLWQILY